MMFDDVYTLIIMMSQNPQLNCGDCINRLNSMIILQVNGFRDFGQPPIFMMHNMSDLICLLYTMRENH